jgi:uncharacterized protein YerC
MTKRPAWISKNADGKDSIWRAQPDIAIQAARFGNKFPSRPTLGAGDQELDPDHDPRAHLYQLTVAQFFKDVCTIDEWHSYAETYPDQVIGADQNIQKSNPNVTTRAYYLREALPKLLELTKAPSAMAADLCAILTILVPDGAESRSKVQRAILDDPTASLQQIADRTGASPGQISKDGAAGLLIWPADDVGKVPPGSK